MTSVKFGFILFLCCTWSGRKPIYHTPLLFLPNCIANRGM